MLGEQPNQLELKLNHLVNVTSSHVCYVECFLSGSNLEREAWDQARQKLLQISSHLIEGIDEIVENLDSKVLRQKLDKSKRSLAKTIHQLLVECGPENQMMAPAVLTRNLSINPTISQNKELNDEIKYLSDIFSKQCQIWSEDFLTVGRIPVEASFGADFNSRQILDILLRFMAQLSQVQIRYSKAVLRDYITVRTQALIRAGNTNQAYLLLFASFLFDSR